MDEFVWVCVYEWAFVCVKAFQVVGEQFVGAIRKKEVGYLVGGE